MWEVCVDGRGVLRVVSVGRECCVKCMGRDYVGKWERINLLLSFL